MKQVEIARIVSIGFLVPGNPVDLRIFCEGPNGNDIEIIFKRYASDKIAPGLEKLIEYLIPPR